MRQVATAIPTGLSGRDKAPDSVKPSPSSLDPDDLPDIPHDEDQELDEHIDTNKEQEGLTIQTILHQNTKTIIQTKKFKIESHANNQRSIFNFDKIAIEKYPCQKNIINIEIAQISAQISYEELCEEVLVSYDWQKQIKNEQNYGAYFPNFQKEIMKNPFFKLTAGDFNDVLKKCQFIRSRWLGEKIRSTRCGQYGKAKWKPGEKIKELDLFAIKLYTDFESCQRELKKCYRPPSIENELEMQQYEQRFVIYNKFISLNIHIFR